MKIGGRLGDKRRNRGHGNAPPSCRRYINSSRDNRHRGDEFKVWACIDYLNVNGVV